jgi:hypothetical protein
MKKLLFIFALALVGCDGLHVPSYDELKKYPKSCAKEEKQVVELTRYQNLKNFPDLEYMSEQDRAYNKLLKETIWWYAMECHREKTVTPSDFSQ